MTIASQTSRIAYTGDGATTAFSVPFYFAANADLVVYLQDTLGNQTIQLLGTNYNLSGATLTAGGTCTFVVAPTSGYLVTIYRDPAVTQTTSYNNNDPFPAKSHELALDKLTTIAQRVKDLVSRAIHQTEGEAAMTTALASLATRKNKLLGFGTNGELTYPLGPTFVNGTATGVAEVDSRATAQVTSFNGSVNVIVTYGYSAFGDGGGSPYKRVATQPSHNGKFQSGDGAWWEVIAGLRGINARAFGATGNGSTDDTTAIQGAINMVGARTTGGVVYFPAGKHVVSATLAVTAPLVSLVGEHKDSVQILRSADFGPTVKYGGSATLLLGGEISNLWFIDSNSSMTLANSSHHIVLEHTARQTIKDVQISLGAGGILLSGAAKTFMDRVYMSLTGGSSTGRSGVRVRKSPVFGATNPLGGDIHCEVLHIEGDPTAGLGIDDGIRLESCDGFYMGPGCHVINTQIANVHLLKNGSDQLTNIGLNCELLDITLGHGVFIDGTAGTGAIDRLNITADVACAGAGAAGKHGIFFNNIAGATNVRISGQISGWQGDGIRCDSPFVSDVTIEPQMKANQGNGIYLSDGDRFTIRNPAIGGDGAGTCGIRLGASVNDVFVSGGNVGNTGGVGIQIDSGATKITIDGVDLRDNPSGGLVDSSSGNLKLIRNCAGVTPLFGSATYDPPSIANGGRTTTTVVVVGAAVGDFVDSISTTVDLVGLQLTAYVSSTSTVTVVYQNNTGVAVDLVSHTLSAVVVKRFA